MLTNQILEQKMMMKEDSINYKDSYKKYGSFIMQKNLKNFAKTIAF